MGGLVKVTSNAVKVIERHQNGVHDGLTDAFKRIARSALSTLLIVSMIAAEDDVEGLGEAKDKDEIYNPKLNEITQNNFANQENKWPQYLDPSAEEKEVRPGPKHYEHCQVGLYVLCSW